MTAYYNEFDPLKAEVLREAIKAGAIAPGDVDERSISDVRPADLEGYTQCHFFAGGGFWSLALRNAGWPDDRPVWTGSCPCPSFSSAGKGGGFDDPRHLWPDWARLIRECRPPVIFGEQADAAVGFGWVDLVQTDLEAAAYAFGKVVFGAHSVGAPHIRQRLYFCADTGLPPGHAEQQHEPWQGLRRESTAADNAGVGPSVTSCVGSYATGIRHVRRRTSEEGAGSEEGERGVAEFEPERPCDAGDCTNPEHDGHDRQTAGASTIAHSDQQDFGIPYGDCAAGLSSDTDGRKSSNGDLQRRGEHGLFAQDSGTGDTSDVSSGDEQRLREREARSRPGQLQVGGHCSTGVDLDAKLAGLQGHSGDVREWRGPGWLDPLTARSIAETGATRGFWADCDWWLGRPEPGFPEGRYRPIGPGLQPLAHGSKARVGRLRLYGDAIVTTQAAEFIKAYIEARGE